MVSEPISVIVPTLNEAGNITRLMERLHQTFIKKHVPYEVIMVDDYSTDKTIEVAKSLQKKYPLRILMKRGTRGKSYSLLQGFQAAHYQLLCMIDADLQYPPEAIAKMYDELQNKRVDVVVTERVDNQTSAMRKLSSKVFNTVFARMLFGINYDSQSGLKLFRKKVIDSIEISPSPWSFDLEFLVRAIDKHFKITSMRIPFAKRTSGEAKVHMVSATIELMKASLKLKLKTRKQHSTYRSRTEALKHLLVVATMATVIGTATPGAVIAAQHRNDNHKNQSSRQDYRQSQTTKKSSKNKHGTTSQQAITKTSTAPKPPKSPAVATPTQAAPVMSSATPTKTTRINSTATAQATPTPPSTPPATPTTSQAQQHTSGTHNTAQNGDLYASQTMPKHQMAQYLNHATKAVLIGITLLSLVVVLAVLKRIGKLIWQPQRTIKNGV